jgi:hypothetical protein
MKKSLYIISFACFVLFLTLTPSKGAELSRETEECIECHSELMPGLIRQWNSSKHKIRGIGCFECHNVERTEADAIAHEGAIVTTIVTPEDCGKCHEKEMEEFLASSHATSRDIFITKSESMEELPEKALLTFTCRQCHGSMVEIRKDGTPDPDTWPNSGIGRINPDGSKGACSACHIGHRFSKEDTRRPEVCGRCHLGPDHPQLDIYEESKHGIQYEAYESTLKLKSEKWVAGMDYFDAPTCATCHMGATRHQPVTHDVGKRLSRKLRASIITKREDSEEKLENMRDVCKSCHSFRFIDNFYQQTDNIIEMYNTRFAIPAKEIRAFLVSEGVIKKSDLTEKLEWQYKEFLYHEGRKAQHAAAMGGADYAWRHGIYNVAKHFYTEFLPAVETACKKAGRPELYEKALDKYLKTDIKTKLLNNDSDPQKTEEPKDE